MLRVREDPLYPSAFWTSGAEQGDIVIWLAVAASLETLSEEAAAQFIAEPRARRAGVPAAGSRTVLYQDLVVPHERAEEPRCRLSAGRLFGVGGR